MATILIQLDDATLKSLEQIAPAAGGHRADFIRQAIREAIRRRESEQIREAYLQQPDSSTEADDWANAEEWRS